MKSEMLYKQIEALPENLKQELSEYLNYLDFKKNQEDTARKPLNINSDKTFSDKNKSTEKFDEPMEVLQSFKLTLDEKIEMVKILFKREDRLKDGMNVLRILYPEADEKIIHTAAFELFLEGSWSILNLLVELELFLQKKTDNIYGLDSEILLCLYNWSIKEKLLMISKGGIIDEFVELEEMIKNREKRKPILNQLERVKDLLDGLTSPPDWE
jgi:hypothetical protein